MSILLLAQGWAQHPKVSRALKHVRLQGNGWAPETGTSRTTAEAAGSCTLPRSSQNYRKKMVVYIKSFPIKDNKALQLIKLIKRIKLVKNSFIKTFTFLLSRDSCDFELQSTQVAMRGLKRTGNINHVKNQASPRLSQHSFKQRSSLAH